jgi:type I restriction enzyme R subunit
MDDELIPYPEQVRRRYEDWLEAQQQQGRAFTTEQRWWLDRIAEHVGVSLSVSADDLMGGEFQNQGGLFKARQVFGPDLPLLLDELNAALVG